MAIVKECQITPYSRPLPPAVIGQRAMTERFGWHVRLSTDEGIEGWGDVAPWPGFGHPFSTVRDTLITLPERLVGKSIPTHSGLDGIIDTLELCGAVAHGVEGALLDVISQREGVSLSEFLCEGSPLRIPVHALIEGSEDTQSYQRSGVGTFKMKVGGETHVDLARVASVRSVAPSIRLRLDANGLWTRGEALTFAYGLRELGDVILEQPVNAADIGAFAWLKGQTGTKLAADESFLRSPNEVLHDPTIDEVVLKPMFLGGLLPTLQFAQHANAVGKTVCITHALESEVGRLNAQAVAAGFAHHGSHGVCLAGQAITNGLIERSRVPGLGRAA